MTYARFAVVFYVFLALLLPSGVCTLHIYVHIPLFGIGADGVDVELIAVRAAYFSAWLRLWALAMPCAIPISAQREPNVMTPPISMFHGLDRAAANPERGPSTRFGRP